MKPCYRQVYSGSDDHCIGSLVSSYCIYSTEYSHPNQQYLVVLPFHSSLHKSAGHFSNSFMFNAPKIWNDLPSNVSLLPPSGTKLNSIFFACKSLSVLACLPCFSDMTCVYGSTISLYVCLLFLFRICQMIEIKCNKILIRLD